MKSPVSKGLGARQCLPPILILLLAFPPGIGAQSPAPPAQTKPIAALPIVQSLKIIALAGNGEVNDIERGVMAPIVVNVLDQNGRPVEGADVVFRFPIKGPGASFADQKSFQTVKTNADGQAAASGWVANGQLGSFQVHLNASRGNEVGEAVISMTNVARVTGDGKPKQKSMWSSRWVKIAIIAGAAGAAAGVYLATRGSGSSNTTVTPTPGTPTIGGPR